MGLSPLLCRCSGWCCVEDAVHVRIDDGSGRVIERFRQLIIYLIRIDSCMGGVNNMNDETSTQKMSLLTNYVLNDDFRRAQRHVSNRNPVSRPLTPFIGWY